MGQTENKDTLHVHVAGLTLRPCQALLLSRTIDWYLSLIRSILVPWIKLWTYRLC